MVEKKSFEEERKSVEEEVAIICSIPGKKNIKTKDIVIEASAVKSEVFRNEDKGEDFKEEETETKRKVGRPRNIIQDQQANNTEEHKAATNTHQKMKAEDIKTETSSAKSDSSRSGDCYEEGDTKGDATITKRKVGRPRKVIPDQQANSTEEYKTPMNTSQTSQTVIKRSVGRPRKYPVVALSNPGMINVNTKSMEQDMKAVIKRPVGRPRKYNVEAPSNLGMKNGDVQFREQDTRTVTKRSVGRPRKYPVVAPSNPGSSSMRQMADSNRQFVRNQSLQDTPEIIGDGARVTRNRVRVASNVGNGIYGSSSPHDNSQCPYYPYRGTTSAHDNSQCPYSPYRGGPGSSSARDSNQYPVPNLPFGGLGHVPTQSFHNNNQCPYRGTPGILSTHDNNLCPYLPRGNVWTTSTHDNNLCPYFPYRGITTAHDNNQCPYFPYRGMLGQLSEEGAPLEPRIQMQFAAEMGFYLGSRMAQQQNVQNVSQTEAQGTSAQQPEKMYE